MRKLIFILFLFPLFVIGQDIDSLKLAVKNAKHDTTRCNILSVLAETASDEEWPAFNEQLRTLAEKNVVNNTSPKFFYLKHLAAALNNAGYLASKKGNVPGALEYFHKGLKIREEIDDKPGIINTLSNIGSVYESQGDIPKALEYFRKGLEIGKEVVDGDGMAVCLNNIGLIYRNQGDIPKALDYYHKSLKISEEMGYKKATASSLSNIGSIYGDQGDNTEALGYYHKSLKIEEEIVDKEGMAISLNNIASIYRRQGDIPKALDYNYKSLKIVEEIGDKQGIATSLNNIGYIYFGQGDFQKGLEYYHKSLKIKEEIGDKEGEALLLNNIANLTLKIGQVKKAQVFATKGMQVAKELGFPENILNSANLLKIIFKIQNKHKEAFEMYELEVKMRDSINNEETQKAAVKKQMQYEYESKAKELKFEQDKKDLLAKEELIQKEKERNYFIIGFALVIVLAGFIFRSYRQKQKANILITHQKKEVEESRKEILDSIHYAKRIQRAHLPSGTYIANTMGRLNSKNSPKT